MIPPLSEALAERGFDTLTPVQQAVTEPDIGAADLLVSAQTGSGKTVGFGLAIAPTLLDDAHQFGPAGTPLALIVAPTRELAFQVMQELRWLYGKTGALVNACVGGMDIRQERRLLERGTHIVVGTPGRLCDHIRRGALDLSDASAVVLDEADEMLDLGFREDLEFILQSAPAERRTLLFSATVSPVIAKLAAQFQRDAQRINTIDKAQQHADIAYRALKVAASDSDHAIFNLLRFHGDESAIVFANTRAAVNHLTARLSNRGLPVVSLSGELSQSERSHALQAMRDGRARVCVATDVAARGIDLPNLNLVIHADLPTNTESLLHRSGRTGRAGRKGMSALIVPPKMVKRAERLLKWAKINAEWAAPPSAEDILARDEEHLLTDPAWDEPLTEAQTAFAEKLLARHSPQLVAAALLRLHQARHAAPEDLQDPDTGPKREPRDFGPSQWFSLSVGRKDRAEPRWLLPMLLRATDLEKAAIGAIRVQEDETFVELSQAQAGAFMAALGPDAALDDGITVRALDSAPDLGRPPRRPRPEGAGPRRAGPGKGPRDYGDKPAPRGDKPHRPYKDKPKRDDAVHSAARPKSDRGKPGGGKFDGKPGGGKPERAKFGGDKPGGDKAGGKPYRPKGDKPKSDRPKSDWSKPDRPKSDRPAKPAKSFKPAESGPAAKPAPKPKGPKRPAGNLSDPSARLGRAGKPAKPGKGGKPGAKPGKPGGKPGGKRPVRGGDAMPRRRS